MPTLFPFLLLLFAAGDLPTPISGVPIHFATTTTTSPHPLSPRASLLRYWSRKIPNGAPKPSFLLSKSSPLSFPAFSSYLSVPLPSRLRSFCRDANLLCFPDLSPELDNGGRSGDFEKYSNSNFSNYDTKASAGKSSFSSYSPDDNVPIDTFRRYSRDSDRRDDSFSAYSANGNVVTTNFTSYSGNADAGSDEFRSYHNSANNPNLKFSNYAAKSNDRKGSFGSYSDDTNAGDQSFSGYGQDADSSPNDFKSYSKNSNVVGSTFKGYSQSAKDPLNTFSGYGFDGNVPENTFSSYSDDAEGKIVQKFSSYREQANVGDDKFTSYGKSTTGAESEFENYGQSANVGSDSFKGYDGGENPTVGFKIYGSNNSFKGYSDVGTTSFRSYRNTSTGAFASMAKVTDGVRSGRLVNKWIEPGKFFRENGIRPGSVLPFPDVRDKMPVRSFLPRAIADRVPFSTARLGELYRLFNATIDSSLGKAMADTVKECERKPSRGEMKKCVTSVEDMIDFATGVLGNDVVVRSTDNPTGSGKDIVIGKVRGINGGKVTKSVSCHQSLFPYMVYYCHSVPKVRVYETEILDAESNKLINHGIAICHLDTSDWSSSHGAFVALGPGPGKIEVCHWIFQGDMTWAVSDE